ncbi:MAG TPA: hypothetical protein VFR86_26915 [Burkholderiaceae bacterium]|nr:hypothetical protein [Burkholderiaceae bacterium]
MKRRDMHLSATEPDPSENKLDRAKEEAFTNEGAPPAPDQDTPPADAPKNGAAGATGHRGSAPAGLFFPGRRTDYRVLA